MAPVGADQKHALAAVDALLADLDKLAASAAQEESFYEVVLERLRPLGCQALAVWKANGSEGPHLAWTSLNGAQEKGHESWLEMNVSAAAKALQDGKCCIVDTADGAVTNGAAARSAAIFAPWTTATGSRGAMQAWLNQPIQSTARQGYLQLFAAIGEVLAGYASRQEQQRTQRQLEQKTKLEMFNHSLHDSLELEEVAYRIANDGRALVGCERLAVAVCQRGKCKILAVSGADHVHRRSETIGQLQRLCDRVVASGQALTYSGGPQELAPQLSAALADYLDVSPALSLLIIPLVKPAREQETPPRPVGALVLEQFQQPLAESSRALVDGVLPHSRQALANALAVRSIPLHRFWLARGDEGWLPRWATRSVIALAVLTAVGATLALVPADVRLRARGELQPALRHDVFAPRDGVVTAVITSHGARVKEGDKLLEMRSPELDLELQRAAGELETTRKKLAATQSERLQMKPGDAEARVRQRRLTADEEQLHKQVAAQEERLAMLQEQQAQLTVKSPVSGEVVTWDLEQQLAARPLRRGDALLTVAQVEGAWRLELKLPGRRAGRLLAARESGAKDQQVSFRLATSPGQSFVGTVQEVAPRVEIDESGDSYLLVTVNCEGAKIPQRVPGATALARIDCGRGSLGESLFHEFLDAARLWLPF